MAIQFTRFPKRTVESAPAEKEKPYDLCRCGHSRFGHETRWPFYLFFWIKPRDVECRQCLCPAFDRLGEFSYDEVRALKGYNFWFAPDKSPGSSVAERRVVKNISEESARVVEAGGVRNPKVSSERVVASSSLAPGTISSGGSSAAERPESHPGGVPASSELAQAGGVANPSEKRTAGLSPAPQTKRYVLLELAYDPASRLPLHEWNWRQLLGVAARPLAIDVRAGLADIKDALDHEC